MKKPITLSVALLLLVATPPSQSQINFTRVNNAVPATDRFDGTGCAFVDYDNDGYVDLSVGNWSGNNRLYHNERNGTFRSITSGIMVSEGVNESYGMAWGDYNNDGHVDLFVGNGYGSGRPNFLYRNNGDGTFTKILDGPIVSTFGHFSGCAWADYDRDGYLDLMVANNESGSSVLYLNDGADLFIPFSAAPSVISDAVGVAWADFNNDGRPDLCVANGYGAGFALNFLYANRGTGVFESLAAPAFPSAQLSSCGLAWGDYDNDGFLDVFITNTGNNPNELYHNNGDGTFTAVTVGSVVTDRAVSSICAAWVDYDNDGWLDLFVGNRTLNNAAPQRSALYHNNGNGTFTREGSGPIADYTGSVGGCAWGDYDNDGFPDLYVTSLSFLLQFGANALFQNTGNSNYWLKVKCVGGPSNRAGIGAKVRVQATIGGQTVRQMREITSGDGLGSSGLLAHFGLGDATNIDTVRIEWPSGTVQVLSKVSAGQLLTVIEPPHMQMLRPTPGQPVNIVLTGAIGLQYALETSSDLAQWIPWTTVTCTNRMVTVAETNDSPSVRFYRAVTN